MNDKLLHLLQQLRTIQHEWQKELKTPDDLDRKIQAYELICQCCDELEWTVIKGDNHAKD